MYKLFIKKNVDTYKFLEEILYTYNITNYTVKYNGYNKPYLENNPIYFNISHDNELTVIAISNKPIGVDIEEFTYQDLVIEKYYNEEEKELIKKCINKEYMFTKIWVMKEAYVKMIGIGLEYGLRNVNTLMIKDKIDIKEYENYLIAVCRGDE